MHPPGTSLGYRLAPAAAAHPHFTNPPPAHATDAAFTERLDSSAKRK